MAVVLPETVARQVRIWQKQFGPKRWRINLPPHVTLIRPWQTQRSVAQAVAGFESIKLLTASFMIDCQGVGEFAHPGAYVLYSPISDDAGLQRLHDELSPALRELGYLPQERQYHPHITLANKLSRAEYEQAKAQLEQKDLSYNFVCSEVSLLKQVPEDPQWVEIGRLGLAAGAQPAADLL